MAVKPPKIAIERIPTDKNVIYGSVRHSLRQYAASLGLFSDDGGPWDLDAFDSLDKEKQKDEVWNALQSRGAPAPAPAPAAAPKSAKQPEPEQGPVVVTSETARRGRGRPPKAASADMPPAAAKQPEAEPAQQTIPTQQRQAPAAAPQAQYPTAIDTETQQLLTSTETFAAKAAANSQEIHREVMAIKDNVAANTQLLKAVLYFLSSVAEGQGLAEDWRDLVKDAIGHKDCVDITGVFEKGK